MKLSQVLVHAVLSKDRNLAGKMEPYGGRMERQPGRLCMATEALFAILLILRVFNWSPLGVESRNT